MEYATLLERTDTLLESLAAGDALGATSELKLHRDIPDLYKKVRDEGWPFLQVGRGIFSQEPGMPTDETGMASVMVRSFRELYGFHPQDITEKLINWKRSNPPGIKPSVIAALSWAACSDNWYDGGLHEYLHGPDLHSISSLGRNGVIAGMAQDLDRALKYSVHHCMITDFRPIAAICCCAHTFLLMELLGGGHPADDWRSDFDLLLRMWLSREKDVAIGLWRETVGDQFEEHMHEFMSQDFSSGEWTPLSKDWSREKESPLFTLRIALWALHWSLSDDAVRIPHTYLPPEVFNLRGPFVLGWVALIGHHADTYASVAGPLLAAAHGRLPEGMTRNLVIRDRI